MQKRNKNKIIRFPDFVRYNGKQMSEKERNTFERELQRDSFAEEAAEGFASISPQDALKDVSNLQNQLKKRVVNRQRLIFYRVAASMAVLLAISSIFIIIETNKPTEQIASNINSAEPAEIAESPPITQRVSKTERSEQPGNPEKESQRFGNRNNKQEAEGIDIQVENNLLVDYQHKDSISEIEVEPPEVNLKSEQIAASSPGTARAKKSELSEEAIADYDAVKAVSEKEDMPAGYKPPQPYGGKSVFDKYVSENLHHPGRPSSEQKAIVVLNFLVRTDGSVDSIKVLRSPGQAFSDEAIRLLRSGPLWHPAEDNGQIIEDQVRLRIVFK